MIKQDVPVGMIKTKSVSLHFKKLKVKSLTAIILQKYYYYINNNTNNIILINIIIIIIII